MSDWRKKNMKRNIQCRVPVLFCCVNDTALEWLKGQRGELELCLGALVGNTVGRGRVVSGRERQNGCDIEGTVKRLERRGQRPGLRVGGGRVEDRQARVCARRSGVWGLGVELCPGVVQQFLNILFLETFYPLKKFEDLEEFWFVWVIFIDIYYIRN